MSPEAPARPSPHRQRQGFIREGWRWQAVTRVNRVIHLSKGGKGKKERGNAKLQSNSAMLWWEGLGAYMPPWSSLTATGGAAGSSLMGEGRGDGASNSCSRLPGASWLSLFSEDESSGQCPDDGRPSWTSWWHLQVGPSASPPPRPPFSLDWLQLTFFPCPVHSYSPGTDQA